MSDRIHLGVVPESPAIVTRDEFPSLAREDWLAAKDAYRSAHHHMDSLLDLLYKPGEVKVLGQTTGALYEAKKLRDDADRMVVALSQIVDNAKAVHDR